MTAPLIDPPTRRSRFFAPLTRHPRSTALAAGLASATGFAPLALWPVTLFALALLLWLLESTGGKRRAFGLGWLFGFGHFLIGLNWIAVAFTFQAAMPAWLGWVAVVLIAALAALYPALAALNAWWVWQRVGKHEPRALTLLFAAAWIVTEWLRSWLFTGFAWNPLGAVLLPTAFAGYATAIGTYGLAGLTILLAGALRWGISALGNRSQRAPLSRSGSLIGLGFALIFVAPALFAMLAPALLPARPINQSGTPVTIVQPNIEQGDKWDPVARAENFRRLATLSPRRPNGERRLLLWPEAAIPDYLESGYPVSWYDEPPAATRSRLARLLSPGDLLLTGAVKLHPNAAGTDIVGARNSLFVLDAAGQLGPRYDKAHLVPFGEYLPWRSLLEPIGLARLAPGAVDFLPGPGPRTLDLRQQGFGTVGIQICYEIIFSGQVVDRANRPDFLFNPSNDAWFGSWGPPQHLAQARLRAIEEGLPVVRATPTGISAIIAPDGRIIASVAPHSAGRIDTRLPAPYPPTLFARYGNLLPLLFATLLAIAGVAIARRCR